MYKVLLLLVTMAWGASFVYMKDMVAVFPPGWLLGIRFTIAGLVILPFLLKRLRLRLTWKALAAGMVMGLLDFLGFFTQTVGLQTVSPGINAFLTAVYVVLVPFMWWVVAKRKPTKANIVAAFVAIVGIWLVSVTSASGSLSIGFGEIMTLLCAFFFAAHIISVSIFSVFYDVLMLTVIQFITEGLLGLASFYRCRLRNAPRTHADHAGHGRVSLHSWCYSRPSSRSACRISRLRASSPRQASLSLES